RGTAAWQQHGYSARLGAGPNSDSPAYTTCRVSCERWVGIAGRMGQTGYYGVVIALSALNVVLAVVAYVQRSKQIRGNRLREEQVRLAEARNEMAQSRLHRLEEQIALMTDIRDALQAAQLYPTAQDGDRARPVVGVIDVGSATMRLMVG